MLALLALSVSCTVITDTDDSPVRCVVGSTGCPGDLVCGADGSGGGICVPPVAGCEPTGEIDTCREPNGIDDDCDGVVDPAVEELCNGLDDNCNGEIDEGFEVVVERCNGLDDNCNGEVDETHDEDGDGFTWCGVVCDAGICEPDMAAADCNDDRETVNPGAGEACNGVSDDCDDSIDEGATCADAGDVCLRGECINPSDCRDVPEICDEGFRCNLETGSCETGNCTLDPLLCVLPEVCDEDSGDCVTLAENGEDCDSGGECRSGVCMTRDSLGLPSGARSGICAVACCGEAGCADGETCYHASTGARGCVPTTLVPGADETCSRDSDCADDCVVLIEDGAAVPMCGSHVEDLRPGDACDAASDCVCIGRVCRQVCGNSDECAGATNLCWSTGLVVRDDPVGFVPLCREVETAGSKTNGEPCVEGSECRDLVCLDDQCSDVCCDDSSCGTDQHCVPYLIDSDSDWYEMHCRD